MDDLNQPTTPQNPPLNEPVPPVQPAEPPAQTIPPIQPPLPPPQSRSFLSKPLIILLIVFVLFAIFYAGMYFKLNSMITNIITPPKLTPTSVAQIPTPTPDPTTNWKTYTNTKYSLSFKYPSTWFFKDAAGIAPGTYLASIAFFKNGTTPHISTGRGDNGNEVLYLYISNPTFNNKTITETKEQFIQEIRTLNQSAITVDGHPAGYDSNYKSYSIWYNDTIQIYISPWNDGVEAEKNINAILSTFKFLDQNSTNQKYTCPADGWENCMPILDAPAKIQCSKEALDWKKTNCPNFQGAAY